MSTRDGSRWAITINQMCWSKELLTPSKTVISGRCRQSSHSKWSRGKAASSSCHIVMMFGRSVLSYSRWRMASLLIPRRNAKCKLWDRSRSSPNASYSFREGKRSEFSIVFTWPRWICSTTWRKRCVVLMLMVSARTSSLSISFCGCLTQIHWGG